MALDVLPPACLAGRGDDTKDKNGWRLEWWIERLGVPSPQVKLWLDMSGFYVERMFEADRKAECLVQDACLAAQWVLIMLDRTPQNTVHRNNKIATEAARDYYETHPSSKMRYRWAWGYDVTSEVLVRVAAEMAAELPDEASILHVPTKWLMEKATGHIGWRTQYVGDMLEGWYPMSNDASGAISVAKERREGVRGERRVERARRRQEGKEAARMQHQKARQQEQARRAEERQRQRAPCARWGEGLRRWSEGLRR